MIIRNWRTQLRRLKVSRLKTQQESVFQFEFKGRKKQMSQLEGSPTQVPPLLPGGSALLLSSGLQLIGRGPRTLARAICCAQSANSHVSLIRHHPEDTATIMFDPIIVAPWPSQLTPATNYCTVLRNSNLFILGRF